MRRVLRGGASALVALAVATFPAPSDAQDHLKCYKVKDPAGKATYTADLVGLVAEPGCLIKVPAQLACVPSTKANVTPAPPGGGGTGVPNTFACYKVKCPKGALPTVTLNDQFGSRTATPLVAKLLCAPVAPASTTTTTSTLAGTTSTSTTTSSSTTTTTAPCAAAGNPCGTCGDGFCAEHFPDLALICVSTATCSSLPGGDTCTDEVLQCPAGQVCIAVPGPNPCCGPCP